MPLSVVPLHVMVPWDGLVTHLLLHHVGLIELWGFALIDFKCHHALGNPLFVVSSHWWVPLSFLDCGLLMLFLHFWCWQYHVWLGMDGLTKALGLITKFQVRLRSRFVLKRVWIEIYVDHLFTMVRGVSLRNLLVIPYRIDNGWVRSLFTTKALLDTPLLGHKISWVRVLTVSSGQRCVALRMLHDHPIAEDALAPLTLRACADPAHVVDGLYSWQVGH